MVWGMTELKTISNHSSIEQKTIEQSIVANKFLDQITHTWINQYLGGSYIAYQLSIIDWLMHLTVSPGTQIKLINSAYQKIISCLTDYDQYNSNDRRFKNELWTKFPFNLYVESFLFCEQFWHEAINIQGVTKHHQLMNHFMVQQILNMIAPTNFILTNPEILSITQQQQGANFVKGFNNLIEDTVRTIYKLPPSDKEQFQIGKELAVTPGKVIYRNNLIELIQYSPTTEQVYEAPVLIVPACIMKYYILDLSSHNSLVKYLVNEGHTVFMISWKNPEAIDQKLGIDDYVNLGIMATLDVINSIMPGLPINAAGYCIGGTLLAVAAAFMAGKSDNRLQSITFFAAQVDFTYAGEVLAFIDESQISMLEDVMGQQGYLDGKQMASAFAVMHSHDLIWGRLIRDYFIGERQSLFDIMAWNADATRLPCKMHSEYLEEFFLKNSLIQGDFIVNGEGISLVNIKVPVFAVSTSTDHVAPWKSVYKLHFFTKTDLTFLLTTGGHNVGIVSEPGHKGRSYQVMTRKKQDNCLAPDAWKKSAPSYEGSWWPEWQRWLVSRSGIKTNPPSMGNQHKGHVVLCDAPGTYVFKK